ncbi:hypothetical protein LIAUS_18420 [Leptospira interrogans]
MNSTERAFYGSPFWAQKGTFFKCSNKNESSYLQKVCFSDREKFSVPPKNRENSAQRFPMGRVGNSTQRFPMGRVGNSTQRFPMGRVGNSTQRFPMGRVGNSTQRFPMGRVGKLNTTLSYGSRWKTQHNAFLWVALENSTQRFPMGRVGKLNTTLSYGSRCGVGYGKGRSAEFSRIDPFRFIPNSCF